MPRLSVWLGGVPVIEAVAEPPGATVETVPMASELAGPGLPAGPGTVEAAPVAPGIP